MLFSFGSFLSRLRLLTLLYSSLCLGASIASAAEVKIPAELKVKVKRLAKIQAVSETPVKWLNLHEDLDLIPDTGGRSAILLGAKPGRYKIAAYTADKDGPSDPAYCLVIVEPDEGDKPAPPPPPQPKPHSPVEAIVKIRFGSAGCTATIIGPQRSDGRWDVLSAAHCISGVGANGQMVLKDGRSYKLTVAKVNRTADISWLLSEPIAEQLPSAALATTAPPPGTKIWHMGYGFHLPGNREDGTINSAIDSNGQIRMKLNVSSGDSGGGIFHADTGELVACVCCTSGIAKFADVWGGSSIAALKLRGAAELEIINPIVVHPIEMIENTD